MNCSSIILYEEIVNHTTFLLPLEVQIIISHSFNVSMSYGTQIFKYMKTIFGHCGKDNNSPDIFLGYQKSVVSKIKI